MAFTSFLLSSPLPFSISREKTNPTISSRVRCCSHDDFHNNSSIKLRNAPDDETLSRFPEKASAMARVGNCPRPRRIILVRHGQSEGNVNENLYTMVPDPMIGLTQKGWEEAEECGKRIRAMIESDGEDDWKVYFYVSPYKRTLETLRGLGRAFDRERIVGVREEPRLREQDFGNFQNREKMRVEKEIRNRYGRFFYRFPDGESAADVYDRITGFRETLRADIDIGRFQPPGQWTKNMNLVIVSHGLTLRVFLMRWYKWTVDQFQGLNNFKNGGILVMETGFGGRYSLLVHHSTEELQEFGLTEKMLADQKWYLIQASLDFLNVINVEVLVNWAVFGWEWLKLADLVMVIPLSKNRFLECTSCLCSVQQTSIQLCCHSKQKRCQPTFCFLYIEFK